MTAVAHAATASTKTDFRSTIMTTIFYGMKNLVVSTD